MQIRFLTGSSIHFTFSLDKGIYITVWKITMPLILLITLCACVLHWVGVK
jgi:hypothetical protein